jgi:glucose-6-phosphate 1-epimerase
MQPLCSRLYTEIVTTIDLQQLNDNFAIPGVLAFDENEHGLVRAAVTTTACIAELYLQGAHLVLFLSEKSSFAPGKAIRGGIPLCFPWFGSRTATPDDPHMDGPSHGFARTSLWQLAFAALAGDDLHLTLTLAPNETSRALGFDHFHVAYELILGRELRLRLTVANQGDTPLHFEEALHTYFSVGDAERIRIHGLADTEYLDKTDNFARKRQTETTLTLRGETDRPYLNTAAAVTLDDPILQRRIETSKANSLTTVVWNPWIEATAKLADMAPDGWRQMVCIETADAAENAITLHPREAHVMEAHIRVRELPGEEITAEEFTAEELAGK